MRRLQEISFSISSRVLRTMCRLSRGVFKARSAFGKVIGQVIPHQQALALMSQQLARIRSVGAAAGYFTEIAIFPPRRGPQKLPAITFERRVARPIAKRRAGMFSRRSTFR